MKKFLGLAAIIAALGFLFAAAGCSNASDSNNAALLGLLNGTPAPTELEIPLTLEAIEDGKFVFTNPWSTFKYKKNGGEFETVTTTNLGTNRDVAYIEVAAGDKVALYADGSENDSVAGKYFTIVSRKSCYVYGNVMSLESSTDFENLTVVKESSAFANLFTDYHTPEFIGHQKNKIRSHAKITLQLPATTLTESCYESMFYECGELERAPALPATTLASQCYTGMFMACYKLQNAPELPAKELKEECYYSMFMACTSLNYIKCLAESGITTDNTSNWTKNVASDGTFVKANGVDWPTGNSGIPSGWTAQTAVPEYDISTSGISNGTVTASVNSTNASTAEANATVTLTASPATGYQLSSIAVTKASGEAVTTSGDGLTRTFTMPAENVSVSATFTQISYSITKQTMSHGSVTVDTSSTSNATSAAYNTPVILTIKPDTGYELGSISASTASSAITLSGSGITNGSARTFSMPAGNVTVSATFTLINYSITTSGIANGTVTAKNSSGQAITSATYGQTVTLEIAAANYYDYTADSISVTGVSNLGGSGLTRSFTMPAQNVTVSATFFTGPTVAATEAKELGDIVLDNGLVVRYADRDKMTASQKSAAVAIIFDAANKKGVGVKIGEDKKWCSDDAGLYNTNEYTVNTDDGAVNKSNAHPHMVVWSAGAYPAFWFAEVENRKGIFNDDNWYLPAENELKTLFTNLESVNNSFDALGITSKIGNNQWFWSSSCFDPSKFPDASQQKAIMVVTPDTSPTWSGGTAKTSEFRACGVRVFN